EFFRILNRHNSKSIDVDGARKDDGAAIILYYEKIAGGRGANEPGGPDNQLWKWEGSGRDRRLKSKWSELVLDVGDNGKLIQRPPKAPATPQLWRIVEVKDSTQLPHAAAPAPDQPIIHLTNGDFATGELVDSDDSEVLR